MKNHWLDRKVDKEIDAAFAEIVEFKDTDFVDLSNVTQHNDRYKEYDRLDLNLEITKEIDKEIITSLKTYDINTSTDKEDREMIKAIMLKNMHKTHWMEEVLCDVQYVPHLAPGCDPSINEYLTITSTDVGFAVPGGDGILIEGGFPQDDEKSLMQWSAGTANLDIFYPDNEFIQNEKLQVIKDINTDVTQYQTMYTPVAVGTMTGTIYPTPGNTSYGFVFYVSADGKFEVTQFLQDENGKVEYGNGSDDPWKKCEGDDALTLQKMADGEFDDRFMGWYDEVYTHESNINLQTGVLELHYHMGIQPEIIVSYEYKREGSL